MRVENGIGLNDYMTGTLRDIIRTMNMMISNMATIDSRSRVLGQGAFDAMRQNIIAAEISLDRLEQELLQINRAQERVSSGTSNWGMNLMGIYSLLSLIKGAFAAFNGAMTFVDGYTTANARLGLINDGLRTQLELQDMVAESAGRARASYQATANLVTSIGMTGAMKSTEDAVGFAEKVNKLLVIGGGGAQQNQAALLQLSQAMASGRLQGDEYRSLRENAPAMMAALAKGLNVGMGELRQMSTDGLLTTEAIIKAFDNMGSNIDEQFAAMPVTFSQNLQMMKDNIGRWAATMAESGGIQKINEMFKELNLWMQSASGQEFLVKIAAGINIAVYSIELLTDGFKLLFDVIDALGPISDVVIYGLLVAGVILATQALWGLIPPILTATASFIMMNLPIILISAAIVALIMLLNYFGVSAADIVTFVGGLFGGLFAFLFNIIITVSNLFVSVAEFLINIFIDPIYAIKKLFWDLTNTVSEFFWGMIDGIIDGLNWIIRKTNEIAGTSFKIIKKVSYEAMPEPTSNKEVVKLNKYALASYNDFASKGADIGMGFLNKINNGFDIAKMGSAANYGNLDTIDKVKKIGSIDSDLNIAKEDLKYLLELTTQKNVNQINLTVQTAAPIINNNGTIREEADLDKMSDKMAVALEEARIVSAETK